MKSSIAALCVAMGLPCAAASGAIFFTFQDPGPEREVTIQENEDNSLSFMYSFVDTVALSLTSDAGEIADTTFAQTRLTLSVSTDGSPVVDTPGLYLLAITVTPRRPESSGGIIFDFQMPFEVSGPDGPGGAFFIDSWTTPPALVGGQPGMYMSIGTIRSQPRTTE